MALDALSKLTRQFSRKPDFERLIDILLMTLCGQFSVADTFAMLQMPGEGKAIQTFFGTGRLKREPMLSSWEIMPGVGRHALDNGGAWRVGSGESEDEGAGPSSILAECGVSVLCPLVHGDKFIGIIGIGERVNRRPYEQEDLDLLTAIINTVTPLVANSYLFREISSLNCWYLDVLNSVKQGVFVFDTENRLKKINSAGLKIIRTFRPEVSDVESLNGKPIELVFPGTVFGDWARQFVQARMGEGSTVARTLVARAGEVEGIYNACLSHTEDNAELGTDLIIMLDDVTLQKENEQRLSDLEKAAERGEMAASIAHELNNFVAMVLGGMEIVELSLAGGDLGKAQATLEKIKNNLGNMERFSAGLMDYTKLDARRRKADLNAVVSDTVSFAFRQKRFRRIELVTEFDSNLPEFALDSDQIAQLVLNLMNNAAGAIEEAGGAGGRISITTLYHDGQAVLTVSDNGAGIRPEVNERLFESRVTTKEEGHGYGLLTCARIVANHQGTVSVDSRVGQGATFTIRFPILEESTHGDQSIR